MSSSCHCTKGDGETFVREASSGSGWLGAAGKLLTAFAASPAHQQWKRGRTLTKHRALQKSATHTYDNDSVTEATTT